MSLRELKIWATKPYSFDFLDVENSTKVSWKDATGISGSFSETRITSWKQLHRELSTSANVVAESLWSDANGSYSKFEKFQSYENSFTWLMKFNVDAG